jgi:putative tryptophan/tyrosine transport system substrate-binding protein
MKRREFIALVGGIIVGLPVWPFNGRAQQSAKPVVGVLDIGTPESKTALMVNFRNGLREQGFSEGKNIAFETRYAPSAQPDNLRTLASQLIDFPVTVLVAMGSAGTARAAEAATKTIPIVFANGSDPVKVGLVVSLNRPGGNATGISFYTSALGPKCHELLRELVPQATTVSFLVNPTNPATKGDTKNMEDAARSIGQRIAVVKAANENEIEAAFVAMAKERAEALLVNVDAFFASRAQRLAALAARYRIPTSYNNSIYVKAGGLMSYGDVRANSYRQLGIYAGRILKGEKPADLPVMQPTRFELAINIKTAKALGLTVPTQLLALADQVIK